MPIEFCLTDETVHQGVAVNISPSGLCAYLFTHIAEGQDVAIKTVLPVDCRSAEVRWIRKERDGFYSAGLQFTDPREPFRAVPAPPLTPPGPGSSDAYSPPAPSSADGSSGE